MDEFARRQTEDRRAFIDEAANSLDLTTTVIEKDFWVCWTLRRLMNSKELHGHFTFKGGTSLSKAYNVIHRFSEDVDLTINRQAPLICEVKSPMEKDISGKERGRRIAALKEAAQHYVGTIAMPALMNEIKAALETSEGWELLIDPEDPDAQTLLFIYPKLAGNEENGHDDAYIKPRIKLEFGARGDPEPSEIKSISPYLAAVFPEELPDAICEVPTLSVIRTFWEKVTILHALHHNSKLRDGMSRHYYDTLMLSQSGIVEEACENLDLLEKVVRNKSLMFADNKASYETAIAGPLRLIPGQEILTKLKQDYADMSEMFMEEPPSFEELVDGLSKLEETLNQ
jgi:Nucleotidyl transferase AbiEii toxin, Type IV TA system